LSIKNTEWHKTGKSKFNIIIFNNSAKRAYLVRFRLDIINIGNSLKSRKLHISTGHEGKFLHFTDKIVKDNEYIDT